MRSWFYVVCALVAGPFTLPFLWANSRRSLFHKMSMSAAVLAVWGVGAFALTARMSHAAKGVF